MKFNRALRALSLALTLLASPVAAEQGTIVGPVAGPMTMASLMAIVNASFLAIQSCNSGNSAPANGVGAAATHYQCWANTTTNPFPIQIYDGASWVQRGLLDTSAHTWMVTASGGIAITNLAFSKTAPTISSGFGGGTPTISAPNGTAAFRVTVGTASGTSGTLTMPTAANGWNCFANDLTSHTAANAFVMQVSSTPTSVALFSFSDVMATATWVASDVIAISCTAY